MQKNLFRKAVALISAFAVMLLGFSFSAAAEEVVLSGLSFTAESVNIFSYTICKPFDLSEVLIATPEGAEITDITWRSSKTNRVVVSETGIVSPAESVIKTPTLQKPSYVSTATVTAKSGSISAKCNVFLNPILSLNVGEDYDLSQYIVDTELQNITWTSSLPNTLSVSEDGIVSALGLGQAKITATHSDGRKAEFVTDSIYPVRNAYMDFIAESEENTDFVLNVLNTASNMSESTGKDYSDVNESLFVNFISDLRNKLNLNKSVPAFPGDDASEEEIAEFDKDFNKVFIEAVQDVSNGTAYANFQTVLNKTFPGAGAEILKGIVPEEFTGLREFVLGSIKSHELIELPEYNPNTEFTIVSSNVSSSVDIDMLDQADLPKTITVKSESGLTLTTKVKWDYVPSTDVPGKYEAVGHVDLPAGYVGFDEGFNGNLGNNEGTISAIITVNDKAFSGQLDENTEWRYSYGTLTISGTGAIPDYENPEDAPWYDIKRAINKIVIEDGVTAVGDNSLTGMENLSNNTIILPDSVTSVGNGAFADTKVDNVVLHPDITDIADNAFSGNENVTVFGPSTNTEVSGFVDATGYDFVDTSDNSGVSLICIEALSPKGGQIKFEITGLNLDKQPDEIKVLVVGYNENNTVVASGIVNANAYENGVVLDNANMIYSAKAFLWEYENIRPISAPKSTKVK